MTLSARLHELAIGLRDLGTVRAQAHRVYPGRDADSRRRRARFRRSAFVCARAHRALTAFFSQPRWQAIAQGHPQLLQKVHKPYPWRTPAVEQRVAIVRRHYELALERFGPTLVSAVASAREMPLCGVALPDSQGVLPVTIAKKARFEREGELTLSLLDPFGSLLYSACFTLVERDGQAGLLVGSLNGTAPRDVMRHITKLAWGVRPQSLLVFLLQQVAALAGARFIDAVGRETHAYWGHPRHAEIRFDYDSFWLEEGAVARADGLYALPLAPRRRGAGEIPSQKRSQYQRRYEWLAELALAVRAEWLRAERPIAGP
jgi:uncharacterized protein VirK/YbjX